MRAAAIGVLRKSRFWAEVLLNATRGVLCEAQSHEQISLFQLNNAAAFQRRSLDDHEALAGIKYAENIPGQVSLNLRSHIEHVQPDIVAQ